MAKPKLRLWECPNGKHSAVRAPSRPRKDDVRRYCLKCSEETGKLTERTCPSLERERGAAAEKAKAKREVKAARERQREQEKWVVVCRTAAGEVERVNVRDEVKRCLAMRSLRGAWRPTFPDVTLHWRRDAGRAHASADDNELYFSVAHGMSAERLRSNVVHEVAHLAAGSKRNGKRWDHHGEHYKRVLVEAYAERFPGVVCGSIKRQTAYQIDDRVVDQLRLQSLRRPAGRAAVYQQVEELVVREAVR